MSTATLENLNETLAARQASRLDDFHEIVQRIAGGEYVAEGNAIEPADLEEILLHSGKTAHDLSKAVDLVNRRSDLRRIIADGQDASAKIAVIDAKVREQAAKFEAIQTEHNTIIRQLAFERGQLEQASIQKKHAERELASTAPTGFRQQQTEINGERERLANSRRGLVAEIQRGKAHLVEHQDAIEADRKSSLVPDLRAQASRELAVDNLTTSIARMEAELARLDERYAQLGNDSAGIREAMLLA